MANEIIGKTIEGRRYTSTGANNNQRPVSIEADNGDTGVAATATPFLEFTNAKVDGADKDGRTNLTTYTITGLTPGATDVEGVLCSINDVQYWIPVYKAD
tara:strand:- start:57 stop:356 length:300 start_codon:yes stop_codon:yes gene_type:complete